MTSPESQNVFAAQRPRQSLRRWPQFIFATLIVVMLVQLGVSLTRGRYEHATAEARQHSRHLQAVLAELCQTTDELTRMARTFVVTGNATYEKHFNEILAIRDGRQPRPAHYDKVYWDLVLAFGSPAATGVTESLAAIIARAGFTAEELAQLELAKRDADRLALLEQIAMNAAKGIYRDSHGAFTRRGTPDQAYATRLLHGAEYHKNRGRVMLLIHQTQLRVERRTLAELAQTTRALRRIAQVEAGLTGLTVLLLAGAFLVIHRRIVEPIEQLNASASAVGRNGFFRRVIVEREDELGTLAGALNRMSETVEEQARESATSGERLRHLLESAPAALLLSDGDGRITVATPHAATLLASPCAELEGQPLAKWLPEAGADGLIKRGDAGRQGTLRTTDGRELVVEATQNVLQRPDGSVLVCTTLRDRSQDQSVETERTRQTELQATTLAVSRQPTFTVDETGRITAINEAFEQGFGLHRDAVIGRSVLELDFLADAERRQLHAELTEAARSGARIDRELPVLTRDGFERMNHFLALGFRLADGTAGGVVATLTDVTDHRREESELSSARQELAGSREETASLRAAVAQAREAAARQQTEAAKRQTAAAALAVELENARMQLTKARAGAAASESRTEELKRELAEANTRLVELAQAQKPHGATENETTSAAVTNPVASSDDALEAPPMRIPVEASSTIGDPSANEPERDVEGIPAVERDNDETLAADVGEFTSVEIADEPDHGAPSESQESELATVDHPPEEETPVVAPANETKTSPRAEARRDDADPTAGSAPRDAALPKTVRAEPDAVVPAAGEPSAMGFHDAPVPPATTEVAIGEPRPAKRKRTPRKQKETPDVHADWFGGYDSGKDEAGLVRVTIDPDGVPAVSGLDLRDAINRLELPVQTVVQMVIHFAEGLPQTFGELRAALAAADRDAARRHAHTLAGAAGSFSADALRRLAKTLELALKFEQGDASRMLAELEREAARVMEAARQLGARFADDVGPAVAPIPAAPPGGRKLLTILEELSAALDEGEIEAIGQAVGKLKSAPRPAGMQAGYERLSELIDNFEYADAAAVVRTLMEHAR